MDFSKIENNLGIILPESYREFIRKFRYNKSTTGDHQYLVLMGEDQIISINKLVRDNGFNGKDWPKKYLIIGYYNKDHPFDDFSFINIDVSDSPIFFKTVEKRLNFRALGSLSIGNDYKQFAARIGKLEKILSMNT